MTTVYDKSATLAGTDDGDGNTNINMRQVLPASLLSAGTGTQVQLVFLCGTAEGNETPMVDEVWFGQGGGTPPAFTGDQIQIKFGGAASFNGSAAGVITSDVMTLAQTFDNTKSYTCAWHIANGKNGNVSVATVTNANFFNDSGAASTASQTAPSLPFNSTNTAALLEKIIITASGGGGTVHQNIIEIPQAIGRASYW